MYPFFKEIFTEHLLVLALDIKQHTHNHQTHLEGTLKNADFLALEILFNLSGVGPRICIFIRPQAGLTFLQ